MRFRTGIARRYSRLGSEVVGDNPNLSSLLLGGEYILYYDCYLLFFFFAFWDLLDYFLVTLHDIYDT